MHVLKFGGACLSTTKDIQAIAQKISYRYKQGEKLLVVVSAMGKSTDDLLSLSQQISSHPPLRELDMLLSAGERISMSLMCMALVKLGVPAISFTGSQAGILTKGNHNDAEIFDIRPVRVEEALKQNKVVVLAGFQGVDPHSKEVTTLGRGGSDVTAVAMAAHFKAKSCEILKDVDGVYNVDPKICSSAERFASLSYTQLKTMCELGCKVLHPRAIALAEDLKVNLKIAAAHGENSNFTQVSEPIKDPKLAINIIPNLLKVEFSQSYLKSNWKSYLSHEQIPLPRVLYETKNSVYLTAHSELISYVSQSLNHWNPSGISTTLYEGLGITLLNISFKELKTQFQALNSMEHFVYCDDPKSYLYPVNDAKSIVKKLQL